MNALGIALWVAIGIEVFVLLCILLRAGKPGGLAGGALVVGVLLQLFIVSVTFLAALAVGA